MPDSAVAVKKYKHDGDESEFLAEMMQRYAYGLAADQYNRDQGDDDMRSLSVDGNWPAAEWAARGGNADGTMPPRPRGHYDIISQFPNRVVNQQRMNKRGIKVTPTGEGASKQTAEKLEGRIREIEHASKANSARLNALQQASERGEGIWRVDIEFVSPRSKAKKIVVKRIPNVKSIVGDPDTKEADRSDRKWLFSVQSMTLKDFKADPRFAGARDPDETIRSFPANDTSGISLARNWYSGSGKILIAEYWVVEKIPMRVLFTEGQGDDGIFEDELPDGWKLKGDSIIHEESGTAKKLEDTRDSHRSKVCSYFTNGFDIFSKAEWPGSTIPFPTVVGREKFEPRIGQDGDMPTKESITRKLREPQLAYDVLKANMQESLLQAPKSKWLMDDETIGPYTNMYETAHRNPQAYLLHKKYDSQGQKNDRPERTDFDAVNITYLDIVGNSYIKDAQQAAGMTTVERIAKEAASGIAQQEMNASTDVAAFHIVDSWVGAIEFEYRITEELLRIVEDSERVVGIRGADGSYSSERLVPREDEDGNKVHPYGPPDSHTVTIAVGKDWQSQHQEDNEHIKELAKNPIFAIPTAPMLIDAMELATPTTDLMKKALIASMPPQIAKVYTDKESGKEPLPPEAEQAIQEKDAELAHSKQIIQALSQELEKATQQLESKQMELSARAQTESEKIAASKEIEAMRVEVDKLKIAADVQIARIQQATTLTKTHEELKSKEDIAEHQADHASDIADKEHEHSDVQQDKDLSAAEKAAKAAKGNGK